MNSNFISNESLNNLESIYKNPEKFITREDVQAISIWLKEVEDSENTFQSYKKEAERFVLWLLDKNKLSIKEVTREDILSYKKFLSAPEPAEKWIGPAKPRSHPGWKPFSKPLQNSSIKQALIIIKSMFNYLNKSGFLTKNPFSFGKKEMVVLEKSYRVERFLEKNTFYFVLEVIENLPRSSQKDIFHAERARWLFYLLYFTGARRGEVAKAKMKDFKNEKGLWWWEVKGKGNKKGRIPCQDELMEALVRYRKASNLNSDYPNQDDETPLIISFFRKKESNLSEKSIYLIVKNIFSVAAQISKKEFKGFEKKLELASTHWIRHTSASHQLHAGVPLIIVSQNLRHSNIQTTQRYLHTEEDERHHASQIMKLRNSKQ